MLSGGWCLVNLQVGQPRDEDFGDSSGTIARSRVLVPRPIMATKPIRLNGAKLFLRIVYFVGMTFFIAHSVSAVIGSSLQPAVEPLAVSQPAEPATPIVPNSQQMAQTIMTSGLFDLPPQPASGSGGSPSVPPAAPLDLMKKFSVVGLAPNAHSGGFVILEELATKRQFLAHAGEQVPNAGTVADVQKDRVLFRQGQQEEWLTLALAQFKPLPEPPMRVAQRSPVAKSALPLRLALDRKELVSITTHTSRLLTDVRSVPVVANGRVQGILLETVNHYGPYGQLGLTSGDLLKRVNGVEIQNANMLIRTIQGLKDERTVKFDLLREDRPQTVVIVVR